MRKVVAGGVDDHFGFCSVSTAFPAYFEKSFSAKSSETTLSVVEEIAEKGVDTDGEQFVAEESE